MWILFAITISVIIGILSILFPNIVSDSLSSCLLNEWRYFGGVLVSFLMFLPSKFAFKKVFFKKYKRFELTPKISKTTFVFAFKYNIRVFFFQLLIGFLCDLVELSPFGKGLITANILAFFFFGFIIGNVFELLIFKHYIKKYATISEKVQTEINHMES